MAGSHHPDLPTSLPVWPGPAASKRNSSLGGKWLKVGKHERGGWLGDAWLGGPGLPILEILHREDRHQGYNTPQRHLSLCAEIPPTCNLQEGEGGLELAGNRAVPVSYLWTSS